MLVNRHLKQVTDVDATEKQLEKVDLKHYTVNVGLTVSG